MIKTDSTFAAIDPSGEEPTFSEPWEALVFAMTVHLHRQGVFSWPEWSEKLAHQINQDQSNPSKNYYKSWLSAFTQLLVDKEVVASDEYFAKIETLRDEI